MRKVTTKNDKAEGVTHITPSCGNVFADLGLPDAEELYTKLLLAA